MPNIQGYDAPALDIRPSEIGVEATAAAARRSGAFFNQAAQDFDTLGQRVGSTIRDVGDVAVKYISHKEISQGAAEFAKLHSNLTDQWNNAVKNADPNDASVAGKFNEEVLNPALEKFKGAFTTETGQNWAESHVDALRGHMFEKSAADMSTLAGDAVAVNVRKMTNAWTNTARNDPSSVPFLLDTAASSVKGVVDSSPNLKGTNAAKVTSTILQTTKEQIVKAGALGAIEQSADPEKAAALFADRYPDYVNAHEIDQFAKAARSFKRINDSEERSARVQRDYEAKNDFNTKINDLEAKTMPQNVGDRPQLPADYWDTMRKLATHPGAALEPGRLRTMVTNGEIITERLNKPEPMGRVSHETTMNLLDRIRSDDPAWKLGDTSEIYGAYQRGQLNNADFNFLTREFQNLRSPEGVAIERDRSTFFKQYAASIDSNIDEAGTRSALGSQKMYAAEIDARRQESILRAKGLDPHLVYDPRSEYFFGRPENLAKYHVSMQDALQFRRVPVVPPGTPGPGEVSPVARDGVPAPLRGIAALKYSPSLQQYRDEMTGEIYDRSGKKIK